MSWIEQKQNGVNLRVKVVPNANKNAVAGLLGDDLKVRVQSPPEDGKANKELIKFLAKKLGVSKSKIAIAKGATRRNKAIAVRGLKRNEVVERLLSGA